MVANPEMCPDCRLDAIARRLNMLSHGLREIADRLQVDSPGCAALAWGCCLEAHELAVRTKELLLVD